MFINALNFGIENRFRAHLKIGLWNWSKFVFTYSNSLKLFTFSKGPYQRNRCTSKNNIKSHIFVFYSEPCQISLYLHHNLCITYSHSLQFCLYFKGTYQRNRCTFKINIKSHIFIFYSAPCQIALSLHQKLCFPSSYSLPFFSFFQRYLSKK